ncbi:MAG: nuclear transport factor 2 family protein [Parvibaculum sp.]
MTLLERFITQRGVFEAAYESGDWAPLGAFFHDDITYEVMNMPFHCVIKGREAVLAGLKMSVERFDKLCVRTVGIDSVAYEEGPNVLIHAGIRFERNGSPSISSQLWEIATYRGDRIERLLDIYDAGACGEFEAWMKSWGQGLDPSYA